MILPGITFDLGDDWQYALESSVAYVPGVFGSTRTFTVDKNGNPFESGVEYRLWAKNAVLGVNDPVLYTFKINNDGSINVLYAPTTGASTGTSGGTSSDVNLSTVLANTNSQVILSQLNLQATTDRGNTANNPIELTGTDGKDFIRSLPSQNTVGGWRLNIAGELRSIIGNLVGGLLGWLDTKTGYYFGLLGDTFKSTAVRVDFADAAAKVRTLTLTSLPAASATASALVAEPDGAGNYTVKSITPAQQVANLLPALQPYLNLAQGGYQVEVLGCTSVPTPALDLQDFNITSSASFDTDIPHGLNVPGSLIWPDLRDSKNNPAFSLIEIAFSSSAPWTYRLTAANDDIKNSFVGTLRLQKRTIYS